MFHEVIYACVSQIYRESDMRWLDQLRAPLEQGEQGEQGGSVEDFEAELDAYILEIPAKAD